MKRVSDFGGLVAFFLLFSLGLTAPCTAQVQYAIKELGTLGGSNYSRAYGINNSGEIVGIASVAGDYTGHAFLYSSSGSMRDLGTLGGIGSVARAINESGQVVGYADTNDSYHAFLYGGTMADLGTLGGPTSAALAINENGRIVGNAFTTSGAAATYHAFACSNNLPMQDLETLGGSQSIAYGINSGGQIVGYSTIASSGENRAFIYSGAGPMQDLGLPGGRAFAINDNGQIVGDADGGAFLYSGGGSVKYLGTASTALAINNNGQVVGYSTASGHYRAFRYTSSGAIQDLNSLIAPSSGWTLQEANDINDRGQIVGYGTNSAAQTRAFLLSPLSTITTGIPTNTPGSALKPVDPTVTPPSGRLKQWNGNSWQSVTTWTDPNIHSDQPTVVLAHGWNDQIADDNWTASLATTLQQQNPNANILGSRIIHQTVSLRRSTRK